MAKRERDQYEDVIRRARNREDVGLELTNLFFDAIDTQDVERVRTLLKYVDINRSTSKYVWIEGKDVILSPLLFCGIYEDRSFEIFEMILADPRIDLNGKNRHTSLMYYIYYAPLRFTERLLKHPGLDVKCTWRV